MTTQNAIHGLIEPLIEASAAELTTKTNQRHAPAQEGMLFLGPWHDSYPSILVRDPFLTDSAKVQLLYLLQEARKRPNGAIAMPTIQQTCEKLRHSKGTVIRDRPPTG